MLILSRRESECIHLGDDIILTIVRVSGEKVRIGVEAPPHIKILRNELEISLGTNQGGKRTEPVTPEVPGGAEVSGPGGSPTIIPMMAHSLPPVRKVPILVKRAA